VNSTKIKIAGRTVGPGYPAFVIAEMSGNHGHNYARAEAIVRAAATAGADAVKLQTYTADTITLDCDNEYFTIKDGPWAGRNLYDLYEEAHTPWGWQTRLKTLGDSLGVEVFSTPFDPTSIDFLEQELGVNLYKIASFELVDLPLIRQVAATGKPIIMSTGMATADEIAEAVAAAKEAGCSEIALLKCTSAYPAPAEEMNLRTIPDLAGRFDVPVGLSDHTLGISVPVAAVAIGASIIEKHLTLSRAEPGPDSAFSLEPEEFKAMVEAVRVAEKALGRVSYELTEHERASRTFRRSLFIVKDIEAGEALTEQNVRSIRPGYGMPPKDLAEVMGRRAIRGIAAGTPLCWELVR
jgi:pseudaminic acid synthase